MSAQVASDDACWSRIGIGGDGSCAELERVVHCRNCAVYARAGRQLLEQAAPPGYLERWAEQLAATQEVEVSETVSTVVFRIGGELLALETTAFVEVVEMPALHAVPHRSDGILLGVANVRGELQLCVSLAALLSIDPPDAEPAGAAREPRRLVVIERGGEEWVFAVDEILGVHRVARGDLVPAPATVVRDAGALTAALFELEARRVALLDAALLFGRLRRAIG
jgi:chemotaxis-related protein WspD